MTLDQTVCSHQTITTSEISSRRPFRPKCTMQCSLLPYLEIAALEKELPNTRLYIVTANDKVLFEEIHTEVGRSK